MTPSILKQKSFRFGVRIVKLHKHFVEKKEQFSLTTQLYRSGTSIGANVEEAGQAESLADFVHKLSISLKEAVETHYWIRLFKEGDVLTSKEADSLLADCEELLRLLTTSIKTAKAKLSKGK
jgi:four helix bundle protein